jgi:hypothetical protein
MVVIKPKLSTYISLGLILLALLTGLVLLMADFSYKATFPLWFYLVACSLLTVVIVMLLVKMMAGWRFISVGRDHILIRLPLRKSTRAYPIEQILLWEEEIILANKREFKQVTIAFQDKHSITVSNHEHEAYESLVSYLKKKAQKQMIKTKKA